MIKNVKKTLDSGFMNAIVEYIYENKPNKFDLSKKKNELSRYYSVHKVPSDIEIFLNADDKDLDFLKPYLTIKPVRSGSGVTVVAIMTKPQVCPGKCIYCPGGLNSIFGDQPKSYTGQEPATRRGARNDFDPYLQIWNRLEQYIVSGHIPDKIELIIMGATFPAFPKSYKIPFIRDVFKAMNDFSDLFYVKKDDDSFEFNFTKFKEFFDLPALDLNDPKRTENFKKKVYALKEKNNDTSIEFEQLRNEISKVKCVGITVETRPDYGFLKVGNELLSYGVTRVELGIQSLYDDILEGVKRGHRVEGAVKSIKTLRNLGFKLNFHMMPGLYDKTSPNGRVSFEKDLAGLKLLFEDERFKPDMLKIYPCMVMPGTLLYKLYEEGKFEPLLNDEAKLLLSKFKTYVPRYCRIMRVQRDIPTKMTEKGVSLTNFRQIIQRYMNKNNMVCNCIRCREVKHLVDDSNVELVVDEYIANGGKEFFIHLEDVKNDKIIGFARLRFVSEILRPEFDDKTAIIRELHVYGKTTSVGFTGDIQHVGFGRQLMAKAEEICKKFGMTKLLVISGVGVRNYYRKLGYEREGPYMSKILD